MAKLTKAQRECARDAQETTFRRRSCSPRTVRCWSIRRALRDTGRLWAAPERIPSALVFRSGSACAWSSSSPRGPLEAVGRGPGLGPAARADPGAASWNRRCTSSARSSPWRGGTGSDRHPIDREPASASASRLHWDAAHPQGRARKQPEQRLSWRTWPVSPVDFPRIPPEHIGAAVSIERTLVLVKPDGVAAQPSGRDPEPDRSEGLHPRRVRIVDRSGDLLAKHYAEHVRSRSTNRWLSSCCRGRWSPRSRGPPRDRGLPHPRGHHGPDHGGARHHPRRLRPRLGSHKVQQNLVHGSDSVESAERELNLWF